MRYPKITRLALQYALARSAALGLVSLPLVASAGYLYLLRNLQLQVILSGPRVLLLWGSSVMGLVAVRHHKTILELIERHFFRWQPVNVKRKESRIQVPPGSHLRVLAEFFFSRKTYSEILEPTLRDLFDDYCVALKEKRLGKAHWIRVRGYWSFWSAVFAQLPISAASMVYKIWKATL